jgi:hypothetical protein
MGYFDVKGFQKYNVLSIGPKQFNHATRQTSITIQLSKTSSGMKGLS